MTERTPEENKSIFNAVEAMLFASGTGLTLEQIALGLDMPQLEAKFFVDALARIYQDKDRGLRLTAIGEVYQLSTNPHCGNYLNRVNQKTITNLTRAQIETLAVIAYQQPVTRQAIEQIRGVDSSHAVNKLLEYDLVVDNGRLDVIGRPMVFVTTDQFLRQFGIACVSELPNIDEFKNLVLATDDEPTAPPSV